MSKSKEKKIITELKNEIILLQEEQLRLLALLDKYRGAKKSSKKRSFYKVGGS